MKIGALIKYSMYLLVIILIIFLIFTVYIYFFASNQSIEFGYNFIVPISIFVATLLYSRNIKQRGIIRGLEMWIIYFAVVCLFKLLLNQANEIDIVSHLIFLPIAILGGVIGVNFKK